MRPKEIPLLTAGGKSRIIKPIEGREGSAAKTGANPKLQGRIQTTDGRTEETLQAQAEAMEQLSAIKRWQTMKTHHVDGIMTSGIAAPQFIQTASNVRAMQGALGIEEDGVWGPKTELAFRTRLAAEEAETLEELRRVHQDTSQAQPQESYLKRRRIEKEIERKYVPLIQSKVQSEISRASRPFSANWQEDLGKRNSIVLKQERKRMDNFLKQDAGEAIFAKLTQGYDAASKPTMKELMLYCPTNLRTWGSQTNVAQDHFENKWKSEAEIEKSFDLQIDAVEDSISQLKELQKHAKNDAALEEEMESLLDDRIDLIEEKEQAIAEYRDSVSLENRVDVDSELKGNDKIYALTVCEEIPEEKIPILERLIEEKGFSKVFAGYNWEKTAPIVLEGKKGEVPIVPSDIDMKGYSFVRPRIGESGLEQTRILGVKYSYFYYDKNTERYYFDVYQDGKYKTSVNLGKYPPYDAVAYVEYHEFDAHDEFQIQLRTAIDYWFGIPNLVQTGSQYLLGEDIIGYIPFLEDVLNDEFRYNPREADRSSYYIISVQANYRHHPFAGRGNRMKELLTKRWQ